MKKELMTIKVFDNSYNDTFEVEMYNDGVLDKAIQCFSWAEVTYEIEEFME